MALTDVTRAQIEALDLVAGRALLAVDADEVLVHFLRHFRDFAAAEGWRLNPAARSLDGAMTHVRTGAVSDLPTGLALIDGFFAAEVTRQVAIPGAAEALGRLSDAAQVVVLTNLPHAARAGRIANLGAHGIPYPVVTNSGGKGAALATLAERVAAPVVFVDDSATQIDSAATHAPDVRRLQLIGCAFAAPALRHSLEAEAVVHDWVAGERWITEALD